MSIIENHHEGAQINTGEDLCKQKRLELMSEFHLPPGILPIPMLEFGYNRNTGFVWHKQKSTTYLFKKTGKNVSYAETVTAFIEDRRLKCLTGIKSKELLVWIGITEIFIADSDSNKITFKTSTGISKSFSASAFAYSLHLHYFLKERRKVFNL